MSGMEEQKLRSEIFKNYWGVIAIILGGIWALYNFHILRTEYSAQLDLSVKESKLVALDLDIEVSILDVHCEDKIGLELDVLIENKGSYPIKLNLANEKTGFGVTKVVEGNDSNGHPNVKKFYPSVPYSFHYNGFWAEKKAVVALPNVITKITYFVTVDEPGYYLASFFSAIPQESLNLIEKHTKGKEGGTASALNTWSTIKYFSIPNHTKSIECN
ncbi:hypothetical protein AC626_01555 [Pseudoalteromonas rubra]|uniref:Uncharacterized protein n=2 Tax=Pseudoalteromonas TaxID=53246 RepID=A0A0L0EWY3_9GAMM|nr:hypothetical protein AC626_01555 [Pseudoalteromonas rubra]